jgi:AcrR family transcriptional regulator
MQYGAARRRAMTEKRGGRPTRERAAAMNDLLLDEARALFARRGVAGTSMEEIAAALGWSKHTLYHRYAGKMALLEAVVARDMAYFAQVLTGAGRAMPRRWSGLRPWRWLISRCPRRPPMRRFMRPSCWRRPVRPICASG